MAAAPDAASPARAGDVRAEVLGDDDGGPRSAYQMFDVLEVAADGARLAGPFLLEIGEEVTLRLRRGDAEVEVRARVTAVERGEPGSRDGISRVTFVDADAGRVAPVLAGGV